MTELTICEAIAARAAAAPESPVLLARNSPELTSAGLFALVERTRDYLNAHGIGRGDRIALIIPDHALAQSAYLATVASAVAVPLNPKLTDYELEELCRMTGVRAVLTQPDAAGIRSLADRLSLALFEARTIPGGGVGDFLLSGGTPGACARPGRPEPDDRACILTSSGTTGRPKAIPKSHGLILGRLAVDAGILALSPGDVTINLRPPYLAGPLNIGLLASVVTGGATVIPPAFDGDAFFDDLTRFGITWFTGGPAYHRAILDAAPAHPKAIASHRLRFVRSAGYALPAEMQAEIEATLGVPCVQKYGSSEAGLITCNPLPPGRRKPGTSGPVQDCEVRILNDNGTDAQPDESGEILVRGPHVFAGYDDPEMTRAAFHDGWFRTGDLGAFDADGYLTITGRASEIINRGGQKIAPAEVEAAFSTIPGVAEALCFPVPHTTLGSMTGVAIVPDGSTALDESAMRRRAGERLARFKVPEVILIRDALPRGPTGKPLRREAAAFFGLCGDIDDDGAEADLRPPRDRLEELWCAILKIDRLHDGQNFTRAGGDSIRAIRLQVEVDRSFGIALPAEAMYGPGSTPAGLRALIAAAKPSGAPAQASALPKRPDPEAVLPLASWQRRIWSHTRLHADRALYNCSLALRFPGPFDPVSIRRAGSTLAARHEVLRATFPVRDGLPEQRFVPRLDPSLTIADLRHIPAALREDALARAVTDSMRRPYDLEAGPLFRLAAFRVSDADTLVQIETHHIVTDAISSSILSREFTRCLEAFRAGETPDLPVIERDFGDLVRHHADRMAADGPSMIARWTERLADVPPFIELPTDRPRPRNASRAGNRIFFKYPPGLAERVRRAAAENGSSPYALLLAAFETLVGRMTGRDRFLVGAVVNVRPPEYHDRIVGFGLNTVPLRVDLDPTATFRDQIQQARKRLAELRDDAEVPFDELVRRLADPEDRSAPPLVQILFSFMPRGTRPEDTRYADRRLWNLSGGGSRFDLTMMLDDTEAGIGGLVEYATELYDEATIRSLVDRYRFVLENLVADPTQPLDDCEIVSPDELAVIEGYARGPVLAYPSDATIPEVFRDAVARAPDALAVIHGDERLSYRDLDARSDALAAQLLAEGIAPGTVVGVSTERTVAAIVSILAVLKAGAAYQPLDPGLPAERIAAMIEDAGTALDLVQKGSVLSLPATVPSRPVPARWAPPDTAPDLPQVSSRDLAYVIFTSGSTGRAKGVEIEHRAVLRTVIAQPALEIGPGTRIAATGSFGFDASVFEIFGALLNGGTLVLPPAPMPSINDYADLLIAHRVDVAWFTAGLFREMVDWRIDCFAGLRQLLVGGDVVPADRALRLVEAHPNCHVTNGYGPTENTVFSLLGRLEPAELRQGLTPLGRPLANSSAWILDDRRRPVPPGVEGELHLGGDGVARGYRNRPDLTAAAFAPDPFSPESAGRLYASGDRARFRSDGRIEFLGRRDSQLKIRGFRVELGEIETCLKDHSGVADALAFVRRDGATVKDIAVAVVPGSPDAPPEIADLRTHLARSLPGYMVPAGYGFVDRFPLNASGKVDRTALAALPAFADAAPAAVAVTPPRTPLEELLFGIWTRLLAREDFGIDQNFFALGGSSLEMMQLGFLVTQETGLDIPMIDIFETATIRDMALLVLQRLVDEGDDVLEPGG